jgi:hypothetical protein
MEFECSLSCSQKSNVSPYLSNLNSFYIFTSNFPEFHFADINEPTLQRFLTFQTFHIKNSSSFPLLMSCQNSFTHARTFMTIYNTNFYTEQSFAHTHSLIFRTTPFQLSTPAISSIHNPRMCYVLVIRDPLA